MKVVINRRKRFILLAVILLLAIGTIVYSLMRPDGNTEDDAPDTATVDLENIKSYDEMVLEGGTAEEKSMLYFDRATKAIFAGDYESALQDLARAGQGVDGQALLPILSSEALVYSRLEQLERVVELAEQALNIIGDEKELSMAQTNWQEIRQKAAAGEDPFPPAGDPNEEY